MLWLFILDYFECLDCPECDGCDCNDCLNENFNQGKCHFIVPIFFLCMYFIFSIDAWLGCFSLVIYAMLWIPSRIAICSTQLLFVAIVGSCLVVLLDAWFGIHELCVVRRWNVFFYNEKNYVNETPGRIGMLGMSARWIGGDRRLGNKEIGQVSSIVASCTTACYMGSVLTK
jgi:hypothetical protein